jgi:hypothetical protein
MYSCLNATDIPRPQREHTEIEEELYERAHIDYDRVAIVSASVTTFTIEISSPYFSN